MVKRLLLGVAMACFMTSSAMADFTSDTSNPNLAIADDAFDGTLGSMQSDTIVVAGHGGGNQVTMVTVDITMNHTWVGDLTIALQAPNGQVLGLLSRPDLAEVGDGSDCCGSSSDWISGASVNFADANGTSAETMGTGGDVVGGETFFAAPDSTVAFLGSIANFAAFNGQDANGAWTLYVGDSALGDEGALESWTLSITSFVIPEPSTALFAMASIGAFGLIRRRR